MNKKIGVSIFGVALGLFLMSLLASWAPQPVSGQIATPEIVCVNGTPVQGSTPVAGTPVGGTVPPGVFCLTSTPTDTSTSTSTSTKTPTNTSTKTAVPFFLSVVYNYYGDKHVTVFLNPSPWCVTGNSYKVDVDFGNGVTTTLGLPAISCPPNGSPYQIDAGLPNYTPGLYGLTARLFETAPAPRLIGQAQSLADTRPTATPTQTGTATNTPTQTSTFVVTNRHYSPIIRR